jgi:hypothetical protein
VTDGMLGNLIRKRSAYTAGNGADRDKPSRGKGDEFAVKGFRSHGATTGCISRT